MKTLTATQRKEFSKRVVMIRKNTGMSMDQFAEKIGVSRTNVNSMSRGSVPRDMEVLKKIAVLGNTTVELLLYGDRKATILDELLDRYFPSVKLTEKQRRTLELYLDRNDYFDYDEIELIVRLKEYIRMVVLKDL